MADIPTPRSYNQIVGDMIAAFLARYPVNNLKVGGPILSVMEAAAQSDLRNTADIFKFLASTNLDSSEGMALDKILADENTKRLGSTPSNGLITIGDSRFAKVSSTLYHGKPAPLAGSLTIYTPGALNYTPGGSNTGTLYLGRGTENYEGPIAYTNITFSGSYYTVTLATPTTRFHNLGESVIMGQGGDRTISAGTTCSVAQSNSLIPITFSVIYADVLLDGETSLSEVQVVCTQPGTVGNIVSGGISEFSSAPFTGATVSNPLPFTNGFDAETDEQARTRIRLLRKAKTRGTDSAIEAYLAGVVAQDESKRITSVKVAKREGMPVTAYIDDGTGYEEASDGVAYEILTNSAVGGEQYFQLSLGRPVAKASVTTTSTGPWILGSGAFLVVRVGGLYSQHYFNAENFRSLYNASASEIAHSINSDSTIPFSARLSDSGRKVTIFAKDETNEDIEVVNTNVTDVSGVLGFPSGIVYTCKLFKNDVLLSKDGRAATIESNQQTYWQSLTSGCTLVINVDGTGDTTYTFNDADFTNAGTPYLSVSSDNSLSAWATVLNYKIPGITAIAIGDSLQLTSNAGAVARGSLSIVSGTFVSQSVFSSQTAKARVKDYTLNRNTGQLRLVTPLVAGDKLGVGTENTNAFLESGLIATVVDIPSNPSLWFVIDGQTQSIRLPITSSTTITEDPYFGGTHLHLTCNEPIFASVAVGDWVVNSDPTSPNNGSACRVDNKVSDNDIVIGHRSPTAAAAHSMPLGGWAVVRTKAPIQRILLPAGQYTAEALAAQATLQLEGAHGEVVRTGHFRVISDGRVGGDIMCVQSDPDAYVIPLELRALKNTETTQNATVETGNPENDIPKLNAASVILATAPGTTSNFLSSSSVADLSTNDLMTGARSLGLENVTPNANTYGNALNFTSTISSIALAATNTIAVRETFLPSWATGDRVFFSRPYSIGPLDDISLVLDGDIDSKNYTVALGRKVRGVASGYSGTSMVLDDAENSNQSLRFVFGNDFSFNDYALYMRPRVVTPGDASTANLLWRWNGFGHAADTIRLGFQYPMLPDQPLAWAMGAVKSGISTEYNVFNVIYASGPERTMANLVPTMRVGFLHGTGNQYTILTGLKINGYTVTDHTTYSTVTLGLRTTEYPSGTHATECGLTAGDQLYASFGGGCPLLSGPITVTFATAMAISYDVAPAITPAATTPGDFGTVYFDSPGGSALDWTGWSALDVMSIANTLFPTVIPAQTQPVTITGLSFVPLTGTSLVINAQSGTFTGDPLRVYWSPVPIADGIKVYPINGYNSPAQIAAGVDVGWPVSVVADPANNLVNGQYYASKQDGATYPFTNGINSILTTYPSSVASYSFDLKNVVTTVASRDQFFNTEDLYLVPTTAKALASFLNSPVSGGLGQSSVASASSHGSKLQITSNAQGGYSSIKVAGGLANSAVAPVVGSATTPSATHLAVTISKEQGAGFNAGWYMEITNTQGDTKVSPFNITPALDLTSIGGNTWTFSSTGATKLGSYSTTGVADAWQFERQGRYMVAVWNTGVAPSFPASDPGDFVVFSGGTAASGNLGIFQIIGIDSVNGMIWFENDGGVEERATATTVWCSRDSVMPGDTISVGDVTWGLANRKAFLVVSVNYATGLSFSTAETPASSGAVAGLQPLVSVRTSHPLKMVRKLVSILPVTGDLQATMLFDAGTAYADRITSTYGATVRALSKLEFPLGITKGNDGYNYNTGLIGEANRVLYGLESDPTTYPGVVASGASVNISGPVVRRIQVSLGLRIKNGANRQATFDAVRSSVATYINGLGVGIPVAISSIVNAASAVGGVEAVSVSSPTYSVSSDQISVQPYEKPLILQSDLDIALSLIG